MVASSKVILPAFHTSVFYKYSNCSHINHLQGEAPNSVLGSVCCSFPIWTMTSHLPLAPASSNNSLHCTRQVRTHVFIKKPRLLRLVYGMSKCQFGINASKCILIRAILPTRAANLCRKQCLQSVAIHDMLTH